MRVHITDVISHRGGDKLARATRAFKEIARTSAWPIQKIPGPTHNLRYRFHDRVRQEATTRDIEGKKEERSLPLRAGVARFVDSARSRDELSRGFHRSFPVSVVVSKQEF